MDSLPINHGAKVKLLKHYRGKALPTNTELLEYLERRIDSTEEVKAHHLESTLDRLKALGHMDDVIHAPTSTGADAASHTDSLHRLTRMLMDPTDDNALALLPFVQSTPHDITLAQLLTLQTTRHHVDPALVDIAFTSILAPHPTIQFMSSSSSVDFSTVRASTRAVFANVARHDHSVLLLLTKNEESTA